MTTALKSLPAAAPAPDNLVAVASGKGGVGKTWFSITLAHALARAGHSAKILIADGNYPFFTKRGPNAEMVYLNFTPGLLTATEVLKGILTAVPIEAAEVMTPAKTGR